MKRERTIKVLIPPEGGHRLNALGGQDIEKLNPPNGLSGVFRDCCLAALKAGSDEGIEHISSNHRNFAIRVERTSGGIQFQLENPPPSVLVERHGVLDSCGSHIRSIAMDLLSHGRFSVEQSPDQTTRELKDLLGEQELMEATLAHGRELSRITYWGGQRIPDEDYDYAKAMGDQYARRFVELITGGGLGTMKAPFSGAAKGYRAQRIHNAKMIAVTFPGIIANEPPNTYIDPLVTVPNMEKRLEAFVRLSMGTTVGPGGIGTVEEILYLCSILLDPKNRHHKFALLFTGPNKEYFTTIFKFLEQALGRETWQEFRSKCMVDTGSPIRASKMMAAAVDGNDGIRDFRSRRSISTLWDDRVWIDPDLQKPFIPSHESVAQLRLEQGQPPMQLAAQLRKFATAVVWANVMKEGNEAIEKQGPLQLQGERKVVEAVQHILTFLEEEKRMNFRSRELNYYKIVG